MEKALTLYELNSLVAELINTAMPQSYWVEAEVSEARESRGHLYLELIEKQTHPLHAHRQSVGAHRGRL